ncbi:TonB-dependent receptor [Cystobacter fuscus DSM 2262]|uniref:TonB-dependent receptor n=1 Tax=Cystobacter fuscus (strain ATCC 25194 / DSM 2262 / NBRC 100088 / M29) TaxID=1242864 RepID=S9P395_CYSF2|nr:TonB-dependent receptor [Cystobacter fuscus DSM 2262]
MGTALLVAGLLGTGVSRAQEATPAAPALEAPKLKESAEATYPPQALEERLEAKVVLRLTLDAEGQVTQAEVVGPAGHGFDEAAHEAALRMRFEPARRNGTPMPSRILYTYEFQPPPEPTPPAPPPPPAGSDEPIEVTVQGPSEGERRRRSAESVQVIDTENIKREAADMGEALSRTEGVNVRRSGGLGSRSRFSLAGLTDEQIRFFVDGVPLELAGYGPELANVPVNLVQRVEIYQGIVPIRFGSDALGGAVQLVTDQMVRGTGVAASYELGSFDTHRLTVSGRHLHEPSGLFLRANAFVDSTQNDYSVIAKVGDAFGRPQPRRVYRFHDAYAARGASLEAGFVDKPWARRLLLRAFVTGSDKELQSNPSMTVPYGDATSGENSLGATLRYEQLFSGGFSVDAVAGYVSRRTRLDDIGTCSYNWLGSCQPRTQPGELFSRPVEQRVNQHTGFARLTFGWTPTAEHTLRLSLAPTAVGRTGEELRTRALGQVDPLSADRNLLSLVSGLEYTLGALDDRLENIVFLKDYLQVADAQRLMPDQSFAPIGRSMHGLGVGDGVRLRLLRELTAKASYEYAIRLPRPDEIFGDGALIADNLDLNPERSHNFNLELALDAPDSRVGALRASVVGFGRLADQLITLVGREGYFTYQNVFSARSLGAAGSAGWTSPGQYLSLDGNVTWQDLRNTSREGAFGGFTGKRIPNRPYLQANGTARLQASGLMSARDELSLTWHVRYVHTFSRAWEGVGLVNPDLQIPSQLLQSLALSYVTRAWNWTMGWTVDVQNLTDTPAYDFFGVQRPGRSIFAKLTVEH